MSTEASASPPPTDKQIFDHVLLTVVNRPKLRDALIASGITTIADLLALRPSKYEDIRYPEKGKPIIVEGDVSAIRMLRALDHYHVLKNDVIELDQWHTLTRKMYDQFRVYDSHDYDDMVASMAPPPVPVPAPTVAPATTTIACQPLSLVEQFRKGIKRDQNMFPELKNEELNDNWHRSFETQAHAQDVADVLDHTYSPPDADHADLFAEKQKYVYAVLEAKVLADRGKAIIRTHSSTRDAQKVYAELKQHHTQSTKALMDSSDILTYITSAKLGSDNWQGSTEAFITHWQNQLRLYEHLCKVGEHFSDGQKKTMLQNAVHSIEQLAAVKHNAELERTKTGVALTYDQYCSLLVSAANTYDRTHSGKQPDRRVVFFHDTDDPYDDDPPLDDYNDDTPVSLIAFNAAQQRLRRSFTGSRPPTGSRPLTGRPDRVMMTRTQWASISQEARDIWDKLPDKDKAIILGYSNDKLPIHQRPPDQQPPSQRVNLHEMSVYDYLQAHLHELLDNIHDADDVPTNTTSDATTDSPDTSDDTQPSDNVLVNVLATGKKLSPGDIRWLMSSSLAKKKSANKVKFQANSHTIYRADVHASSLAKHSLVDWGANGGVAGADVRVIHRTNRKVDIQGIDNHMINDVYIGTARGVIMTNKGPVILILHQYALLSKGRTIHAPGQLEWYGNDVNDKSCKVKGGLQRILTQNGYVIPIVFDRGLPRVRIRPFTDDEWYKLPHIVMTDELEWDPSVLDFDPEDHDDWFDTIACVESDPTTNLFDEFGDYRHRVIVQCMDYFCRADDDTLDHIVDRCLYNVHTVGLQYKDVDVETGMFFLDAYEHEQSVLEVLPTPRTTTTREPDYPALRPLFGWIEPDIIKKTLEHSTQLARLPMGTMLKRAFKSNNPALNVHCRSEPVACDIVYSDTPAIDDGSTSAVLFVGLQSKVTDVYGIKSDKQFVNTLEDNIRERGAPTKLTSDRAQVEISKKVEGILRSLFIGSWQSEPHQQQQNPAERRYQTIKNRTNVVLDRSGAPAYMWLLALHLRPCTDDDANRRVDLPDGEDDHSNPPPSVVQSIRDRGLGVHQATDDQPTDGTSDEQPTENLPLFNPEDLIGWTFLLDPQADGTIPRARIAELIHDHESSIEENPTWIKFRCEVGKDKEEEIIAYNDLLNYLLRDEQSPPVLWKFKKIISHQNVDRNSPDYKGSSINIMVEWENGEVTAEPLAIFAADDPVTCAIYARDNNLLEQPGWK